MAYYGSFSSPRWRVRRYNRFSFSDEEIVAKDLSEDTAKALAKDKQDNHNGLGATVFVAEPM